MPHLYAIYTHGNERQDYPRLIRLTLVFIHELGLALTTNAIFFSFLSIQTIKVHRYLWMDVNQRNKWKNFLQSEFRKGEAIAKVFC